MRCATRTRPPVSWGGKDALYMSVTNSTLGRMTHCSVATRDIFCSTKRLSRRHETRVGEYTLICVLFD